MILYATSCSFHVSKDPDVGALGRLAGDGLNAFDLRDLLFQTAFDAHLQRHLGAGTAGTGPAQPHLDDPAFDEARHQANIMADYLRRMGPFEPHRLPLDEMEYTTMPEVAQKRAARFQDI